MRLLIPLLTLTLASACRGGTDTDTDPDADGDGVPASTDCDDADASAYPGAEELCDAVDNDCSGEIDDGATDATPFYADGDGDGFGDPTASQASCEAPAGYVTDATDCDDTDASSSPLGVELCDGADNDCDGTIDDGTADASAFYPDSDGDGFGDGEAVLACAAPEGHAAQDGDCDDAAAAVHPGADELCNDADDNCDGRIDDAPVDPATWYADADKDGHGGTLTTVACAAPAGFVGTSDDCDDTDGTSYPGATEVCDGADNDCDGSADESGATGEKTFYVDGDGDGHGGATTVLACAKPDAATAESTDCNDADPKINPAADEICDPSNVDEDCDGLVDDAQTGVKGRTSYFVDNDKDGFGTDATVELCDQTPTAAVKKGDCNDADAKISPAAAEVCDGSDVDEDCDGKSDDADTSATGQSTFFVDADEDGFGKNVETKACDQTSTMSDNAEDCDDDDAEVNPEADEICNGIDDDCDSSTVERCDKTVFVSSKPFKGDLGGLSGADAKCQALADAAGLKGTYKAWLSNSTGSPASRFTKSSEPYVRFDGTKIANNWTDLVDGTLLAPINQTETGGGPLRTNWCGTSRAPVFSATTQAGLLTTSSSTCSDWTSTSGSAQWGDADATTGQWTQWCSGGTCDWEANIYCFEQ